jgi:hypothetical protein
VREDCTSHTVVYKSNIQSHVVQKVCTVTRVRTIQVACVEAEQVCMCDFLGSLTGT